jgi:DNA gyrase subunit A
MNNLFSNLENSNPTSSSDSKANSPQANNPNTTPSNNLENSTENNLNHIQNTIESGQAKDSSPLIATQSLSVEERIEPRILEKSMEASYLQYAMSVIVSRALPDVRDGLKPVHRRIFYTMHKLGLTPGSKYMKCARVIGDVMGKYHPHADLSIYNALVRLAQDFSMRYPLIDGQGNFGSMDGDNAAAMRYTECRLDKPAVFLLKDIDKDTVNFVDNYDGSQQEPAVLPSLLPNLLINGQTGIAVGMATEIPPHNLSEVCQAILHQIKNPEVEIEALMEFIQGPDLPTGGTIYGQKDILKAYQTGKGKCVIQANTECTENKILVHQIPFQVNKSELLIKIAQLVKEKRIVGIRDIRDESNKNGVRIVIDTKRDTSPEIILNQLFKLTELQTSLHFNMLALVNDGKQPKLLNLKQIIQEFIDHRVQVVTRRTQYDLNKAEEELHILEGLKIALDFIDEVIILIRNSYDKDEAAKKLQDRFEFSTKQTEAILQIRLQTLTSLDKSKIESQYRSLLKLIKKLREILENEQVKIDLICSEIEDLRNKFGTIRKTRIVKACLNDQSKEDFIEKEQVYVQLTNSQYIKILPVSTFRDQGRGGRGVTGFNPKDEDWVKSSFICNSHDYIYAFTNLGRVFKTRTFELPGGSRTSRGQALVNYFKLQPEEIITNILALSKDQEASGEGGLIFATKMGRIKMTKLDRFGNVFQKGIRAITLNDGDELVDVKFSQSAKDKVVLSNSNGKTAIFYRNELNFIGRTGAGVLGTRVKKGEKVISLDVGDYPLDEGEGDQQEDEALISDNKQKTYPSLLVVSENGFGKHSYLGSFRAARRGATGVKNMKITKKTGQLVFTKVMEGKEQTLILTTKKGLTIKIDPQEINQTGRIAQGVTLMKLGSKDKIVSGSLN